MACKKHGLKHDTPSQLSDTFRLGFVYAAQLPQQSAQPVALNDDTIEQMVYSAHPDFDLAHDGLSMTDVIGLVHTALKSAQPVEVQPVIESGLITTETLITRDKQDPEYDPINKNFVYGFRAGHQAARKRWNTASKDAGS